VNTKYLRGDNSSNGKAVENVYECFPGFDVTPSFAFVIETVYYVKSEKS
jgi:hypothetical protein